MAEFTVFYSWQSDLPRKITRDFIRDAAQAAIERIALSVVFEDSPRLDHDTKGVSGIPAIGDTILGKIDTCGVFLADVSLVGETTREGREKKKTPNPNVLLELGYAMGKVGWKRVVLVMNKEFGDAEELPFDLRYRRFPIRYSIADDRSDLEKRCAGLSEEIEAAIRAAAQEEHQAVTEILKRLDGHARRVMRDNGKHQFFWESELKNSIPGQLNVAIHRLLQLGIIECRDFAENEAGYAYTWTYLGRLCFRRLAIPEPPPVPYVSQTHFASEMSAAPGVVTDMSAYDQLSNESKPPEGGGENV